MKFTEEGTLYLTSLVIVGRIALENLVHAFEDERPELLQGPVVENEVTCVRGVVMVGSDDVRAVQLQYTFRCCEWYI